MILEQKQDFISIVVPCHDEEEMLPLYYAKMQEVKRSLPINMELIFINDGSQDKTLSELRKLAAIDGQVHYLSFSRNFGKEAGIYAGLQAACGNYVAVMDADLQDPPTLLPHMYDLLRTGEWDCIATRRKTRKGEPPIRSFFARLFYKIINRISKTTIVDGARDFRMMSRSMVDAVLRITEYNRFSKGIFSWVGFRTKYMEYENIERKAGNTSWNFWSLLRYSLDGIVDYSEVPLNIASFLGFISFVVAVVMAIVFAVRTLIFGNATSGWTSLVVFILGIGGLQLLCLGILGKYVGKTFLETKHRPLFIVQESDEDLRAKQRADHAETAPPKDERDK